jgi:hypothetical protein
MSNNLKFLVHLSSWQGQSKYLYHIFHILEKKMCTFFICNIKLWRLMKPPPIVFYVWELINSRFLNTKSPQLTYVIYVWGSARCFPSEDIYLRQKSSSLGDIYSHLMWSFNVVWWLSPDVFSWSKSLWKAKSMVNWHILVCVCVCVCV